MPVCHKRSNAETQQRTLTTMHCRLRTVTDIKQQGTAATQPHGACHTKQCTPASRTPHIAHSHAAYNKQALHARTTSRTAPTTAQCAIITACTPPRARHTHSTAHSSNNTTHPTETSHPVTHAASAPHSPQSCQAAQRRRDAAGQLVAVQVQLPAEHTNSHRVTPWHPTTPTPASHPRRIAAQRIAAIKSSQTRASQHAACYRSRTTPCASDPKNDTTRQSTGT
jgi:hypothetical protein